MQAAAKGIDAIMINEDTSKTAALWTRARKSAAMVHMSPEMALSTSFHKLWKDAKIILLLSSAMTSIAYNLIVFFNPFREPGKLEFHILNKVAGGKVRSGLDAVGV